LRGPPKLLCGHKAHDRASGPTETGMAPEKCMAQAFGQPLGYRSSL